MLESVARCLVHTLRIAKRWKLKQSRKPHLQTSHHEFHQYCRSPCFPHEAGAFRSYLGEAFSVRDPARTVGIGQFDLTADCCTSVNEVVQYR